MSARCAHIPHSPHSLFVVLVPTWDSHTQRHAECSTVQINILGCLKAYMCYISYVSPCSPINKRATPADMHIYLSLNSWCYILSVIQSQEWKAFLQVLCARKVTIPDSISMFNHTKDKVILKCTHKATVRVPEQTIFETVWVTTFKIFSLNSRFWNFLMERGINK